MCIVLAFYDKADLPWIGHSLSLSTDLAFDLCLKINSSSILFVYFKEYNKILKISIISIGG